MVLDHLGDQSIPAAVLHRESVMDAA